MVTSDKAQTGFGTGTAVDQVVFDRTYGAIAGGWNTEELNPAAFYEYRIIPAEGRSFDFDELSLDISVSAGEMNAVAKYSTDGFRNQEQQLGQPVFFYTRDPQTLTLAADMRVSYPDTLRIRVYAWGATSPTTEFNNRNVRVEGIFTTSIIDQTPELPGMIMSIPEEVMPEEREEMSIMTSADTTYNTVGTYSWTCPAGVTCVKVECWGGGGKGGSMNMNGLGGAGGGGGGAYARSMLTVVPFHTYTVIVGAGGLGGIYPINGDSSSFKDGSTFCVSAIGGNGVLTNATAGASGGSSAACIGETVYSGGNGNDGSGSYGGGGGSSAGINAPGNNGTGSIGGIAPAGGGNGGNGRTTSSGVGLPGNSPGGAGGGAYIFGSGFFEGGAGANGKVIITSIGLTTTSTPTINSPICAGATSVSGTCTEDDGTIIEVFVNGVTVGTTAVVSNAWIKTGLTPLIAGQVVTATANAFEECLSSISAGVTVSALPECIITGNDGPVCPNSSNIYTAQAGMGSYAWSISGNGTITGSASSPSVTVLAGALCNQAFILNLTITDSYGCSSSCSKTVLVNDTQVPTISCVGNQTRNTSPFSCTYKAVGNEFNPTSYGDNCAVTSVINSYNGSSTLAGSFFNLGTTTVIWTATDVCGNTATCSFTVTIIDNQSPVITCPYTGNTNRNTNINVCSYTVVGNEFNATATDNCSIASLGYSLSGATTGSGVNLAGVVFNKGVTTVTWTATDAAGNSISCSFTVTVLDGQQPNITCPGNITVNADAGFCYAWVAIPIISFSDNCPGATISWVFSGATINSGTGQIGYKQFNVGVTTITVTASDGATPPNTKQCVFTVTVVDGQNPVITCPIVGNTNRNVNPGTCTYTAVGNEFNATATDNCGVTSLTYVLSGATVGTGTTLSGVIFNQGLTTVTWTAADASGHVVTCNFTVTVMDNINPVISCPGNINASGPGACTGTITVPNPTYSDNCPPVLSLTWTMTGATIASSPLTGINLIGTYTFNPGVTTITYTVKDNSGNLNTCTFTVTIPPLPQVTASSNSPICYHATLNLYSTPSGGTPSYTYSWTGPAGFTSTIQNPSIPNATPANSGTYTVTITDANGCQAINSINVTVWAQLTEPSICCTQVICDPPFFPPSDPDPLYIQVPVTGGSGVYSYQWQISTTPTGPWTDIAGATSTTYTPVVYTSPRYYQLKVTNVCGTVYSSNVVEISTTISLGGTFNVEINPSGPFCPGATFNYHIESINLSLSGKRIKYTWSADPAYISPSSGGPIGDYDCILWGLICWYWADITFTTHNSTATTVNTTINVYPIIYNADGSVYCELSSEPTTVTIRPFKLICKDNIVTNTNNSSCNAQVPISPFEWVTNSCTSTINWTITGATTGSGTGNIPSPYTFNLGTSSVTYSSTLNGNTTSCSFTVTVIDNVLPTIACPGNISVNVDPGLCKASVAAAALAPLSYGDNCTVTSSNLSWTLAGATIGSGTGLMPTTDFNTGTTTITYTITDASGNTNSCSFTVTVTDNIPPVFTLCPPNEELYSDAGVCYAEYNPVEPNVTDNCILLLSLTWEMTGATSGSGDNSIGPTDFNIGITTIVYTAIDPGGNSASCTFSITVIDAEDPIIAGPFDYYKQNDIGLCSATIATMDPVLSDNCGSSALVLTWTMTGATIDNGTGPIGTYTFNLGTTHVVYTVTDASGNTDTWSFDVHVFDFEAPIINCPPSQNLTCGSEVPSPATNLASFLAAGGTVIDNCPGTIAVEWVDDIISNETCINSFTLARRYQATDISLNSSICIQDFYVDDNIDPSIIYCPEDSTVMVNSGIVYIHYFDSWNALATDNCVTYTLEATLTGATTGGPYPTLNGVIFNQGTTTVTWTATDGCGNTAVCEFDVIVIGTADIAVVKECPASIIPGNEIVYELTVANFGPALAPEINLTDIVPADILGPEFSTDGGATWTDWTGSLMIYDLPNGSNTVILLRGDVDCVISGDLSNTAEVELLTLTDPDLSNNSDICNTAINDPPPTFIAPNDTSYCVLDIFSALWDGQPEPFADIIPEDWVPPDGPRRPDWYIMEAGSTELDVTDINDNCCEESTIQVYWTIRDSNDVVYLSGTGQPSTYDPDSDGDPDPIIFQGNENNTEVEYTIAYYLVDCNGIASSEVERIITIKPRPDIIKTTTP